MQTIHFPGKRSCALFAFLFLIPTLIFAQPGKDGTLTVSTTGVILNRYDLLASSALAGTSVITVTDINNLAGGATGVNNPYKTSALSYGDLIMIIKMQGATITTGNVANSPVSRNPPQADVYGKITNYNNVGKYELAWVQGVSGNTITISNPLNNTFTVGGRERVQVVRIPRLSGLTVNSGASITGLAWSSTYKGGIIALEVNGNATVNGSITATGIGFRGGAVYTGDVDGLVNQFDFVSSTLLSGGEKGEGIAGSQSDYDGLGGRYKRGAPANGGGGGNANCSGGGGGSNVGISATDTSGYKGWGKPDNAPANWSQAWNLETAIIGLTASSSSPGGGRGGYSFGKAAKNPLTTAPATTTWAGDDRKIGGGWGGRPLLYSSNTLFMGGGGGAGDADDGAGGSGGNGGGIVFMSVAGSLSGTGSITADGANGQNTTNVSGNPFNFGKDAAGGGGGGGAIKLNVQNSITGISVFARGGAGGNQYIAANPGNNLVEFEGPGGGGGGGYISVTGNPAITMSATGGAYGTTDAPAMAQFIANGATVGGNGSLIMGSSFSPDDMVVLPFTIKTFDLINSATSNQIQFKWTVSEERNIVEYQIEQSSDLKSWKTVAVRRSENNSALNTYGLQFSSSLHSNTYYRLKAVHSNGTISISAIRQVAKEPSGNKVQILQDGSKVYVSRAGGLFSCKLFNSSGQEVRIIGGGVKHSRLILDKGMLPKGVNYLRVQTENEVSVKAININ